MLHLFSRCILQILFYNWIQRIYLGHKCYFYFVEDQKPANWPKLRFTYTSIILHFNQTNIWCRKNKKTNITVKTEDKGYTTISDLHCFQSLVKASMNEDAFCSSTHLKVFEKELFVQKMYLYITSVSTVRLDVLNKHSFSSIGHCLRNWFF